MAWCQTLCHCQCQSHQLIPQLSVTVQCVSKPLCCCHFNQCVGAAVLSHFCPLSNLLLIANCLLVVVCAMSCVCVRLVGVCCVLSSDGVWGVDGAVCLCPLPKKGSTAHGPVCVWWCTPMRRVVWCVVGECERVLWCGVVGAGKREEANTQSNKNKKDFSQNHFFPFFPPLFHPLFSPCLPLFHYHSLLIRTLTCFSCFIHECIHGEPKTPMTQHRILSIIFSFCPNSLFLFFSFSRWFNVDAITIQYYQITK